jgi:hypothetical protein
MFGNSAIEILKPPPEERLIWSNQRESNGNRHSYEKFNEFRPILLHWWIMIVYYLLPNIIPDNNCVIYILTGVVFHVKSNEPPADVFPN